VNRVPVTNHSDDEQEERNQQQAGGLRGVDGVPAMLVAGPILMLSINHASIVRRTETAVAWCYTTLV
jgi:hypothetical protein